MSMCDKPRASLVTTRPLRWSCRVITSFLLVGLELAHDPYATAPVRHWCDVAGRGRNPGFWPIIPEGDRPRWEWVPLKRVGPLRFGMSPAEVAAALDGEVPSGRIGAFPFWFYGQDGVWDLHEDRFEKAGVSAHYWMVPDGVPRLAAVTAYGRTGPQVYYAEIPLAGVAPSALDAAILRHVEDNDLGLRFSPSGGLIPAEGNLILKAVRAGYATISEPTFGAQDWEM
ncbi:hypothetical protein [Streptomyces sp. NPDC005732]|uniref:hypothetical protein n=1 Tax=Streptomyces sp. NPDC005732 TaxID=3157057 RepID=UPI0033F82804